MLSKENHSNLTGKGVTADECQPWTNYANNGNDYYIIGTVICSEYSNIEYKHLIICNVKDFSDHKLFTDLKHARV